MIRPQLSPQLSPPQMRPPSRQPPALPCGRPQDQLGNAAGCRSPAVLLAVGLPVLCAGVASGWMAGPPGPHSPLPACLLGVFFLRGLGTPFFPGSPARPVKAGSICMVVAPAAPVRSHRQVQGQGTGSPLKRSRLGGRVRGPAWPRQPCNPPLWPLSTCPAVLRSRGLSVHGGDQVGRAKGGARTSAPQPDGPPETRAE